MIAFVAIYVMSLAAVIGLLLAFGLGPSLACILGFIGTTLLFISMAKRKEAWH